MITTIFFSFLLLIIVKFELFSEIVSLSKSYLYNILKINFLEGRAFFEEIVFRIFHLVIPEESPPSGL